MVRNFVRIFLLVLLVLFLFKVTACHRKRQVTTSETVIVAKIEKPVTHLYYSGALQPIKTIPVISPIDGRIETVNFDYGKNVTKGQVMVTLSSTQLADQYHQAVTDYLQKKQAYTNSIESFKGSTALYKAGVLSRETFTLDKSQYENTVLSYFQAKIKLEDILRKLNIDPKEVEKLTLANTSTVHEILGKELGKTEVRAPGEGVALFPITDAGDDKKSGRLRVGNEVKSGQLLVSIGDLSGLATTAQISEISITQIKPGMPVTITGDAFPGIILKGVINSVAAQANPDQGGQPGGGALSLFNIDIRIPKVTPEQAKAIRVGMTAKIEVAIEEAPQIVLPIKAIKLRDGQSIVTIEDANGDRKEVAVVTGTTTPTGVAIVSGVKAGDRVIVHD